MVPYPERDQSDLTLPWLNTPELPRQVNIEPRLFLMISTGTNECDLSEKGPKQRM
jgi:hypothetical protein